MKQGKLARRARHRTGSKASAERRPHKASTPPANDDLPLRSWPGTLEDLEALGDDARVELIRGVLYERPISSFGHGHVVSQLIGTLVAPYVLGKGGPGGWAISHVDWIVGQEVLRPDLSGWRRSRLRNQDPKARASIAPDWILEVLSPSTRAHDLGTKREAYARLGVRYRWYVQPATMVLQTFELRRGQWIEAGVFTDDDVVRAEPFPVARIPMATWWPATSNRAPSNQP